MTISAQDSIPTQTNTSQLAGINTGAHTGDGPNTGEATGTAGAISTDSCTSIYQLISDSAAAYGDQTALTFVKALPPELVDQRISYAELLANINRSVRFFHDLASQQEGADKTEKCRPVISFLLPNIPQTHYVLWAAETLGIANPLNPLLSVEALAGLLTKADTDILVVLGPNPVIDVWEKACAVVQQLEKQPKLVSVVFADNQQDAELQSSFFDAELAGYSDEPLPSDWLPTAEDIAAYFHTGGTTSTPKLALHTHVNQWYSAKAYLDTLDAQVGDSSINGLPMFHVAGATVMTLGAFITGGNLILPTMGGFRDPRVIAQHWQLVEHYQVKISGGIPTSVAAMAEVPVDLADISSLRFLVAGGAPVPQSLVQNIKSLTDLDVYQIYGMTEAAGAITMPNLACPPPPGSAGHISGAIEVKIDLTDQVSDEEGNRGKHGIGEICIRGPMVIPGYLNDKTPLLNNGWLYTGDLGYIDADNNLFITGRSKDVIIRSGHNIDPALIESCLEKHPVVALAAAVGMPDSYAGELPVAFVQLKAEQSVTESELHDFAFEHIDERPACPKAVYILPALPVTAVGKIHKATLRAEAAKSVVAQALEPFMVEVSAQVLSCGGIEVQVTASEDMTDESQTLNKRCEALQAQLNLPIQLQIDHCIPQSISG